MRIALALLSLLSVPSVHAATYVCTRSSENLVTQAYLVTGVCTPTGTYTGAGGDTPGTAATLAATGAVFCGSDKRKPQAVVFGAAGSTADAAAVVLNLDMTTWKLLAFTAAASPGPGAPLVEGDATLTLTNLKFPFVAVCQ
jgi:hypothetical protein